MAHIYNAQLDAFELYHRLLEDESSSSSVRGGPVLPALGHAISGSTGAAISNLAIYPLDLIITRLQVQRQLRKSSSIPDENEYKGVLDAADKIYHKEGGLTAFYQGVVQATGKSIADSFLFFLFYNYLRQSRIQSSGGSSKSLPALDELAVGALAGAFSKFFTTPIANIVTRKQTAAMIASRSTASSKPKEPSVAEIANEIRSEKGIQGFWSGYSASLVLTLNPSITMFLHKFFTQTLVPRSKRDDPGAKLTFLLAALSKAIASSITYPLSVAKARAQTSRLPPVDPAAAGSVTEETLEVKTPEEAGAAGKNATRTAARSTVLASVLKIYRTEGLAALYEGILGEIFKGFFSHGITMLVKETVHRFIIQTYYLILKTLKRYPSPSDLASQANDMAGQVSEKAKDAVGSGKEALDGAYVVAQEQVTVTFNDVSGRVQDIGSNATELAKSGTSHVASFVSEKAGNAEDTLGKGLVGAGKTLEETGKGFEKKKE